MEWHRRVDRPADLGCWVAWLFIVGSILFAVGSFPVYSQLVDPGVVGITFVVGSVCFTTAAAGQIRQVRIAPDAGAATAGVRLALGAAVVQFAGTLLFNLNTVDAMIDGLTTEQTDRLVWAPDFLGSIAFLVASHLGWLSLTTRSRIAEIDDAEWWSARANYAGSVLFMLAAVAAFALPTTGEVLNTALVNSGTCLGALCFLGGSYLLLPPVTGRTPTTVGPTG
jgi:hypothetical protein